MRNEIREYIHKMDVLGDEIQNLMLLEIVIEIRDIFIDLTDEEAEGLMNASWVTKCIASLNKLSRSKLYGSPDVFRLICVLTEPCNCRVSERPACIAADIRKICTIQRNKVRYFRKIYPVVEKLITCLPETETQEAREMLFRQKQNAEEYFEYLLSLYKQRGREEQGKNRKEKYEELEQLEIKPDEKQNLVETEDMIQGIRELIHDREEKYINYFEFGRINDSAMCLSQCTNTERGKTSVRENDVLSAVEEKETAEGD